MNIEEAKEKLHNMAFRDLQTKPYDLKLADVMQILNQIKLDKPQPEIPQFVADWYEEHKHEFYLELHRLAWELIENLDEDCFVPEKTLNSDFKRWYFRNKTAMKTLINMHQFGYTIKKEKKYKVRDKRLSPNQNYLNFDKNSECWFFSNGISTLSLNASHTRKALEESGFNVFDDDNYEIIEVTE